MFLSLSRPSEREPLVSPKSREDLPMEKQAQARYQALRNSDTRAVYTCDSAGVITYYNSQAAELWGREPAGVDTNERFCGSHMRFRTDGKFMPHHDRPMAEVLAGTIPGVFDAEVFIQRPNGSRVVVIVNIAPLVDDNGAIIGAINSFREKPLRSAAKCAQSSPRSPSSRTPDRSRAGSNPTRESAPFRLW
jgi:PAS domain S-box-containing protein